MATSIEAPPRCTAKLCSRCSVLELLGTRRFSILEFEDEWPALTSLKQSAAAGCEFCSMICSSIIPGSDPGFTHVRIVIRPISTLRGKVVALRIFMSYVEVMGNLRQEKAYILMPDQLARDTFLLCKKKSSEDVIPMLSAPTTEVLSERNVGFIQKCIAESTESIETAVLDLPTRLLDLADFHLGRAKLVSSDEIPRQEKIRYAALSYCWGDVDVAEYQSITTLSNQEDRKAGFEIKDLSIVIQDAIKVCSRIDMRYLWVDALCILQAGAPPNGNEDRDAAKEDWDKESQRLWEIFRGSHITICAASSMNCQESFLQDRQLQSGLVVKCRTADGCEIPASSTTLSDPPAYEIIPWPVKAVGKEMDLDAHPFLPLILGSRWYSRGWVHQEISFSRRLLVFCTNMLYMRCRKFQAWENGWLRSGSIDPLLPEVSWYLYLRPFEQFGSNVRKFYNKQITVETDRLPAIAGLASQVAKLTKSQYLAGLWRDNLANDLLFSVGPNRGEMPFEERICELSVPQSKARPSWSWAGYRSSFKHRPGRSHDSWLKMRKNWTLDCVVLEAVAEVDGQNAFGAVKHAHLSLLCRMIALKELLHVEPSAVELSTVLHEGYPDNLEGLKLCWDTNNEAGPVICGANVLFICTSKRPVPWRNDRMGVAGLIIYPAEDGGFYRIGMWEEYTALKGKVRSCVDGHHEWESRTTDLW